MHIRSWPLACSLVVCASIMTLAPGKLVAAPQDDRVLSVNEYTSEKARTLAVKHDGVLRALSATIYHCMPWVEVQKGSIGFFRPKNATRDDRYASVRIYIEQSPSPAFAALNPQQRASAMFSRYVGPLLLRMTQSPALVTDPLLDGFSIILEWVKPGGASGGPEIHETIAAFIDKTTAVEYRNGHARADKLASRARVLEWDGQHPLGAVTLSGWEDNFVATYKVKNYELEPGATCP
jgi:hypothetical protein